MITKIQNNTFGAIKIKQHPSVTITEENMVLKNLVEKHGQKIRLGKKNNKGIKYIETKQNSSKEMKLVQEIAKRQKNLGKKTFGQTISQIIKHIVNKIAIAMR